ncbi:MAG TPA: TonB-dependent receptor, partial [Bacteroidia bacterium]|nr:TonB-dependent receptor [Bacteroidia bacterium]
MNGQDATARIHGKISGTDRKPLPGVSIGVAGTSLGVISDEHGEYSITVPSNRELSIVFSSIGYEQATVKLILAEGEKKQLNRTMLPSIVPLPNITITDPRERSGTLIKIDPKAVEEIPNPSGNFETILKTIGSGVVSNNELSSEYSVRGGNYDENLVYVNDVEIYRPQLVRSGLQEGLSFINPDLVSGIKFSAGGFDAIYGDKMSSALDIKYKRPTEFAGKITYGLLGGGLSLEGTSRNNRFTYLIGGRQKSTKYLLGTLDTKGNYKPVFYDVQALLTYDVSEKTTISLLGNFSKSRYNIVPQTRTTDFGTVSQALRFTVYFDGKEVDDFTTTTGAIIFSHSPKKNINLKVIGSVFNTREEETFDVLGQYFLDELEKDPASQNFGEVKLNLGVGSFLNHARNFLDGKVYSAEHKGTYNYRHNELLWGIRFQHEQFSDQIKEWNYIDSSGYSLPHPQDSVGGSLPSQQQLLLQDVISRDNRLSSNRLSGYLQHNFYFSSTSNFILTPGIRFTWWSLNHVLNISPRIALAYKPRWKRDFNFRLSGGFYYQS